MTTLYYRYSMKPKEDMFRRGSDFVHSTSYNEYSNWEREFKYSGSWEKFAERFAENLQFDLLRAVTVVGVSRTKWREIFDAVRMELRPFRGLSKTLLEGNMPVNWHYFAQQLALEEHKFYNPHFPAHYPEWLLPYGYSQQQYLQDISCYWDDIVDEYYKPWPTTRFGQDSAAVARMRRLGEVAREEIDLAAAQARNIYQSVGYIGDIDQLGYADFDDFDEYDDYYDDEPF